MAYFNDLTEAVFLGPQWSESIEYISVLYVCTRRVSKDVSEREEKCKRLLLGVTVYFIKKMNKQCNIVTVKCVNCRVLPG